MKLPEAEAVSCQTSSGLSKKLWDMFQQILKVLLNLNPLIALDLSWFFKFLGNSLNTTSCLFADILLRVALPLQKYFTTYHILWCIDLASFQWTKSAQTLNKKLFTMFWIKTLRNKHTWLFKHCKNNISNDGLGLLCTFESAKSAIHVRVWILFHSGPIVGQTDLLMLPNWAIVEIIRLRKSAVIEICCPNADVQRQVYTKRVEEIR